ncbi:MAG: hypothetical protein Kow0075_13190 [Salibacteraceae bacterium]
MYTPRTKYQALMALSIAVCMLLGHHVAAQENFKIKGLNISESKRPEEGKLMFTIDRLPWGGVASDCIHQNVELGAWLIYKPKSDHATIIVRTGKGWGDLEKPVIYVGEVANIGGREMLKQVTCSTAKEGATELRVGIENLTPKKAYYVLVTDDNAEQGQRFSAQITDEHTPMAVHTAPEERTSAPYILGRVTTGDGKPKPGVAVSLLKEDLSPLHKSITDARGEFKFERLPVDVPVITRVEEDDTDLNVELYLFDGNGQIKERAVRIGNQLYGFGASSDDFVQLVLLTPGDWTLNVRKGTTGFAGRVVDAQTFLYGKPGLEVGLYDANKQRLQSVTTDLNGRFSFKNITQGEYAVRISGDLANAYAEIVEVDEWNVPFKYSNSGMLRPDGFFKFEKLPTDVVEMKRMEVKDTEMAIPADFKQMTKGSSLVLNHIYFETGSATLKPSSYTELNRLAQALNEQADLRIRIVGHTDNRGSSLTNKLLSEQRALAVKTYLISRGVDENRMEHLGVGDTKPIADNSTEAGRRANRRVEIEILEN